MDLTELCLGGSLVGPPPMTVQEAVGQVAVQNVGIITNHRTRGERVTGGLCAVCKI